MRGKGLGRTRRKRWVEEAKARRYLFATICVRSGGYGQAEEGRRDRMRVTYDERADALYIAFGEGPATVEELAEGIALDWDGEGKLLGIEILDASKRVANAEVLKRWSQED